MSRNNHKNTVLRCEPLKPAPSDGSFPEDFWNYSINPITGFKQEPQRVNHGERIMKKYGQLQQADPSVKISKSIQY
tara:strand:- start:481 stop:708 length:228 start_codon:yes stop_codon:yes gene_type:complete